MSLTGCGSRAVPMQVPFPAHDSGFRPFCQAAAQGDKAGGKVGLPNGFGRARPPAGQRLTGGR